MVVVSRHQALSMVRLLSDTTDPIRCTYLGATPTLVFGGTRNLCDVLDDLDVRPRTLSDTSTVHRGMFRRTLRLWATDEVQDFVDAHPSVRLLGWSLGGGAAVHMAALLHLSGAARVSDVHVFGAPKCGDALFAAWYAQSGLGRRTVRYETPHDPVTTLPPGDRFVHVGRRVVVACDRPTCWAHHDLHAYGEGVRTSPLSRGEEDRM